MQASPADYKSALPGALPGAPCFLGGSQARLLPIANRRSQTLPIANRRSQAALPGGAPSLLLDFGVDVEGGGGGGAVVVGYG